MFCLIGELEAQYHFTEFGIKAGGGLSLPIGSDLAKPSYGINGGFFATHYVCGKRYGYMGSLGFKSQQFHFEENYLFPPDLLEDPSNMKFTYVDVAFYLKVRPKEYHRPRETALLIGPKFSVRTSASMKVNGNSNPIVDDMFKSTNVFLPGIHLSLWMKNKTGSQSFYFQPGVEYYFMPNITTTEEKIFGFYAFINFGYTLWNSRNSGFVKRRH